MSEDYTHLSFTVGPVQSFVAQARRTRDLWAGSWLLSYLTECALAAAERTAVTAIIPYRPEPQTITSVRGPVGGIPNRFELTFADDQVAHAGAHAAKEGFMVAWQSVANAVWDVFVDPFIDKGQDTPDIWKRQVENFWELSWVIGQPEDGEKTIGRLAAARKMLRSVPATVESGVKCSLMGTLQELSGHRPGQNQRSFWAALRQRAGKHDLKETERLCAIALIKRLFPHVIEKAIGGNSRAPGIDLDRLKKQAGWSSTAFFAVQPWLKSVSIDKYERDAQAYMDQARQDGISMNEREAAKKVGLPVWAEIDATVWYPNAVEQNEWGVNSEEKAELLISLRDLHKDVGNSPRAHYAMLIMDGDSMGKLLGKLEGPGVLSECLGKFTSGVEAVIEEHQGRTIYAGGDDVLALLPAPYALNAADKLASKYNDAFKETAAKDDATLSGAIVFTPWKFPLRQVLTIGHHLLDDVAKEGTGRNALAIGIVQGSGLSTVYSAPWPVIRGEAVKTQHPPALQQIAARFGGNAGDQEKAEFNGSFLYHLRDQFGRLLPELRDEPGRFEHLPCELTENKESGEESDGSNLLVDIAHAEYRRRMTKKERKQHPPEETKPHVDKLMTLSRRWWRPAANGNSQPQIECDCNTFSFAGWRVARFLKELNTGETVSDE